MHPLSLYPKISLNVSFLTILFHVRIKPRRWWFWWVVILGWTPPRLRFWSICPPRWKLSSEKFLGQVQWLPGWTNCCVNVLQQWTHKKHSISAWMKYPSQFKNVHTSPLKYFCNCKTFSAPPAIWACCYPRCPLKELDISLNHLDYRTALVLEAWGWPRDICSLRLHLFGKQRELPIWMLVAAPPDWSNSVEAW